MKINQNDMERIEDKLQQGLISVSQANVEMIKVERFRLIKNKIPISIRKSLNEAVRSGILGHMKKEKYKPECYYFLPFKYLADEARLREHNDMIDFISTNNVF